ncbi:MAG: glyceraldehyde-3-phosphate ferredoxin oxidoreductase [Thermoprotei archaeon]|nr:MAG: glyceraldehyde-3-phosphate ferredoxin oxidoreductase [Thermoprotei archaeon]
MKTRVLFINASEKGYWVEEIDDPDIIGPIDLGVKLHLERYKSFEKGVYDGDNVLVFGEGRFAGSSLFGTHRLVFVFKSPLTRGLFASAMGGAAYAFVKTGVDAVVIQGKSEKPLIVKIKGTAEGEPIVEFDTTELNELISVYKGYKKYKGVYAFQEYLIDKYKGLFTKNFRAILIGPAAINTSMGGIFSATVRGGKMDKGSEDWAGRGGCGSVMFRAHRVVAAIFGGEYKRVFPGEDIADPKVINAVFKEVTGKTFVEVVREATVKYHYDPKVGSGGTFGSNYPSLKVRTPMFNWNMIYLPRDLREKLHQMIMEYFWKPFNEESIKPKTWKTCGEPCIVTCKKVRKGYKVDYEPYEGMGPQSGVFELHAADIAVETVDSMGFDAIEFGNVVAWIFEVITKGLLKPEEVGLKEKPEFNPYNYKVEYSKKNAELIVELARKMAYGENEILRIIGEGLRKACKILDERFSERVKKIGVKFEDLAVYPAYGEEGHITPNIYWTPGLIAPVVISGRYWTLYSGVFHDPESYAAAALERAVKELYSDDGGVCRFHRAWAEKIIEKLYEKAYNLKVNLAEHYKRTYSRILEYNVKARAYPVFWDSERTIDLLATAAKEYGNEEWTKRFEEDKKEAAKDWWTRFARKVEEFTGVRFLS